MKLDSNQRGREYYLKNKERVLEQKREYARNNAEKIKEQKIKYYLKNKEWIAEKAAQFYKDNAERIKQRNKKYAQDNSDKIKQRKKDYYYNRGGKQVKQEYESKNRDSINKRKMYNYHNKPNVKIAHNIRRRVLLALKGEMKSKPTFKLLGCDLKTLWEYLESKFKPGMTRENHGKWHIDHIKPCASFNLADPEQQSICFHYTNLQPLWAEDNFKKADKLDYEME